MACRRCRAGASSPCQVGHLLLLPARVSIARLAVRTVFGWTVGGGSTVWVLNNPWLINERTEARQSTCRKALSSCRPRRGPRSVSSFRMRFCRLVRG